MTYITQKAVPTKLVAFEPGNMTRYYLLITKTSEWNFAITDLNNHKVTELSAKHRDADSYQRDLEANGYSHGDAKPMAEFIYQTINNSAYITYSYPLSASSTDTETVWFENKPEEWEAQLNKMESSSYTVLERGTIWE